MLDLNGRRIITNDEIKHTVQKALDEDRLQPPGCCRYEDRTSRPCVIGACLTEEERAWILGHHMNTQRIRLVLELDDCPFEFEDLEFAIRVQNAFDLVDMPRLRRLIADEDPARQSGDAA